MAENEEYNIKKTFCLKKKIYILFITPHTHALAERKRERGDSSVVGKEVQPHVCGLSFFRSLSFYRCRFEKRLLSPAIEGNQMGADAKAIPEL